MSQKYEQFGKYILLEKLASGGMAEVFLARSPSAGGIGRFVAIKKILPQYSDNPEFMQMFKEEAKIALNLSHSNIVSIYEFGIYQGQLFLVMDYVEGRNLRQILNKMKNTKVTFNQDQIVYVLKEVAAGLDHAHRSLNSATGKPLNITHRDMSPQNVMVSFEGEVKIVDFGIAKAETQVEHTKTGTLKGKYGYMSPEQAEGHPLDLRTDIFSTGIVLWELLANDRLFLANNELNTLNKITECNIPSLTKINPNIHPELERIVQKSLARDRNLRYQTAAAMHRDLNRFLNRQYPDFSAHDFSVFVKTLYTDEILSIRKKLVEYSKVSEDSLAVTINMDDDDDKTIVTSFEQTATQQSQVTQPTDISGKETSEPKVVINENGIRIDSQHNIEVPQEKTVTVTQTQTFTQSEVSEESSTSTDNSMSDISDPNELDLYSQTNSNVLDDSALIRATSESSLNTHPTPPPISRRPVGNQNLRPKQSAKSNPKKGFEPLNKSVKKSNSLLNVIAIIAIVISLFFILDSLYSDKKEDPIQKVSVLPQGPNETIRKAPQLLKEDQSKKFVKTVVINSVPSGADIVIDGKFKGYTTPHRLNVPINKSFELTLKKETYISYTRIVNPNNIDYSFTATLQKALIGYVNIDVIPPQNVKIYVNDEILEQRVLPIYRYAVPAKTPVTIKAVNAITRATAKKVITLDIDERQQVNLKLRPSRSRRPSGR